MVAWGAMGWSPRGLVRYNQNQSVELNRLGKSWDWSVRWCWSGLNKGDYMDLVLGTDHDTSSPNFKVSLETVVSDSAHQVTTDLKELHQYLHNKSSHAIKQYEVHSASQHLLIPPFQVRDTIWLDSCNNLDHIDLKEVGPSLLGTIPDCIEGLISHVLNLVCPSHSHASNLVFHVSLLQPTSASEILNRVVDPPPLNWAWWCWLMEVHQILDSQIDHSQKGPAFLYLVEWKGFNNTPEATSWELPWTLGECSPTGSSFSTKLILLKQPLEFWRGQPMFSLLLITLWLTFKNKHFFYIIH